MLSIEPGEPAKMAKSIIHRDLGDGFVAGRVAQYCAPDCVETAGQDIPGRGGGQLTAEHPLESFDTDAGDAAKFAHADFLSQVLIDILASAPQRPLTRAPALLGRQV